MDIIKPKAPPWKARAHAVGLWVVRGCLVAKIRKG